MPRTFFAAAMMLATTEAKQTKALGSGRHGNKIVYRPDVWQNRKESLFVEEVYMTFHEYQESW